MILSKKVRDNHQLLTEVHVCILLLLVVAAAATA